MLPQKPLSKHKTTQPNTTYQKEHKRRFLADYPSQPTSIQKEYVDSGVATEAARALLKNLINQTQRVYSKRSK